MLDILLQDSDITLQLGDVISYFTKPDGSTELLKLEWIPEDYMVIPTYNEEILLQVHNSNTLGQSAATVWPFSLIYDKTKFNAGSYGYFDLAMAPDADHPIAITQDTNGVCRFELAPGNRIISRTIDAVDIPVFDFGTTDRTSVRAKSGSTILDTWKDVPSDKDVMEMTRLKIGINEKCEIFDTGAGTYAHFLECVALGTEIVTSYYIYSIDPSTHMPSISKSGELYTMMTALNFNHWSTTEVPLIAQTGRIDWHPYIIHYTAGSGNTAATKYTYDELFGDMDNSRGIDINTLALIHDAAVLSEFKIESVQAFDQNAKILD